MLHVIQMEMQRMQTLEGGTVDLRLIVTLQDLELHMIDIQIKEFLMVLPK